jgi:hypothetical protein
MYRRVESRFPIQSLVTLFNASTFWLSAILSGFSEVVAIDPFLLWKNREDIEYGTQELRNEW